MSDAHEEKAAGKTSMEVRAIAVSSLSAAFAGITRTEQVVMKKKNSLCHP
jgi:hypothetical protein